MIALALAAGVIGVWTAVPLLDGGPDARPVLSSEDAGQRYGDHDHRLCQLHGAAAWSPAAQMTPPGAELVAASGIPLDPGFRLDLSLLSTNQPRAPPSGRAQQPS